MVASIEETAAELLRCVLTHECDARIIGNVRAIDLARISRLEAESAL